MIDPTKKRVFIWVPGTGGHEVHPAFEAAVKLICQDDAQIIVVEYSAEWDMSDSVPEGVNALKKVLKTVKAEYDPEFHNIYLAGSSQGSWVITEVTSDKELMEPVSKTVMFGHPGVAQNHDHDYQAADTVWEINHPDDVVTFGWSEDRATMVEHFSKAQKLHPKSIAYIIGLALRHPLRLGRFVYVIAAQAGIVRWNSSPHDYSNQMPMATYWMIH